MILVHTAILYLWNLAHLFHKLNCLQKCLNEVAPFQLDLVTYETVLLVKHVRSSDYGGFECVARNDIGFATTTIRLDVTSAPDPPSALTVLNVTHDSVTISWIPGELFIVLTSASA
jgi:nephron